MEARTRAWKVSEDSYMHEGWRRKRKEDWYHHERLDKRLRRDDDICCSWGSSDWENFEVDGMTQSICQSCSENIDNLGTVPPTPYWSEQKIASLPLEKLDIALHNLEETYFKLEKKVHK